MIPPFFRVRALNATASTNEDVKKAAQSGEAEGFVIKAKSQKAGRGRRGSVWESPEGNLYVSVLLRPKVNAAQAALYGFATALAVQDALHKAAPGLATKLKWPNDVLVHHKKICGILLETSGEKNGALDWLVIGAGVNVARCPETASYPATSLAAEGFSVEVDDVLEAFLTNLDRWRQTLERDGFRPVRRAWTASAKAGPLTVRTAGTEKKGVFSGLDDKGRLILRLADGTETFIEAGDVFFS